MCSSGLETPAGNLLYSRWGIHVYQADDYRQDWNAAGQPDGTYYYYLQAASKKPVKGWVEVLR